MKISGNNLKRGVEVPSLKRDRVWHFVPEAKVGRSRSPAGDVLGTVAGDRRRDPEDHGALRRQRHGQETSKPVILLSPIPSRCSDCDGKERPVTMMQKWPVRRGRPYQKKLPPAMPLVTGQRVIDTFFPIAKGGVAAVPGPFGSGKTVIQHQLAKWAEADIVVYIGCGERGNEMTDVLNEFPAAEGPEDRPFPDGAHGPDRQHLGYACRRPGGVDLYRHYHCRVFPRHGLFRCPDG